MYRRRQEEGRWDPSVEVGRFKDNREFSVGVMGLGERCLWAQAPCRLACLAYNLRMKHHRHTTATTNHTAHV